MVKVHLSRKLELEHHDEDYRDRDSDLFPGRRSRSAAAFSTFCQVQVVNLEYSMFIASSLEVWNTGCLVSWGRLCYQIEVFGLQRSGPIFFLTHLRLVQVQVVRFVEPR